MSLQFLYRSPTTPAGPGWVVNLGDQAVRLGNIAGLVMEAELGATGNSSLAFDDPTGTAGHDSDAIVGLKQFSVNELLAPANNRRVWEGYVADRRYSRGTPGSTSPSLRTGAARIIDMTLVDINSFLSFRIFRNGTVNGSNTSFNRPAETDVQRVAALLNVPFLSDTLFDNGLFSTASPVNMDANDYQSQRPLDVLNDCAQQSGKNFFVYYDEVANQFSLFYDFNDSLVYPAYDTALKVSNVLTDVTASGLSGPVWPPLIDAVLTRDPSRVIAGVFIPLGSNSVYRTNLATSFAFGFRDAVSTSPNLKTVAQAEARADRYLAENSTEDDRITFTLHLPAAHVNDWKEGQYAPVKFTHLPGYENYRNVRCLTRTVSQDEETDQFYHVKYECTPMASSPSGAFDHWISGNGSDMHGPSFAVAQPILPRNTTPGNLLVAFISVYTPYGNTIGAPTLAQPGGGGPAWTQQEYHYAYDDTQVIDHNLPIPDRPVGGPPIGAGIWWRKVAVGEMTTMPLAVTKNNVADVVQVWLYEFPTTDSPSLSTHKIYSTATGTFTDGSNLGGGSGSAPISSGSDLAGFAIGMIAVSLVDYGPTPNFTPSAHETILRNTDAHNNPNGVTNSCAVGGGGPHWSVPWTYIAYSPTGQALAPQLYTHDPGNCPSPPCSFNYYNHQAAIGVAMVIPGGFRTIPDIPYPANQSA